MRFRLGCGVLHQLRISKRGGQRLLAADVLACGQGFDRHPGMHVVGSADVDNIHTRVFQKLMPVVRSTLPSPLLGEGLGLLERSCGIHSHLDSTREVKKSSRRQPGVRVGPAHESGSNEPDTDFLLLPARHPVSFRIDA